MSEAEDLRAATREAHEAMKDIRLLMRDARALIAEMQEACVVEVGDQIKFAVGAGLAAHEEAIHDAINEAERLVYQRFAEIGDVLMGEDRNHVRQGKEIKRLISEWAVEGTR